MAESAIKTILFASQSTQAPPHYENCFAALHLHLLTVPIDSELGPLAAASDCRAVIIAATSPSDLLPHLARQTVIPLPIICVTDFNPAEEVALLRAGAHLCLTTTIKGAILARWTAHLVSLLRRGWPSGLLLDLATRQAFHRGRPMRLLPSEFDMLALIAASDDRPVTRAEIEQWIDCEDSRSRRRQATIAIHKFRAAFAGTGAGRLVARSRYSPGFLPDDR